MVVILTAYIYLYPFSFFSRVNLFLKNPSKVNVQVKYLITISLNRKTFEAFLGFQISTHLCQQNPEMYKMELIHDCDGRLETLCDDSVVSIL